MMRRGLGQMAGTGGGFLLRFNRLLIWPTTVLFIVFVFSGYGITNPELAGRLSGGVFTRAFSLYLHIRLTLPVCLLLLVHVLIGLRFALFRWGLRRSRLMDLFLAVLGVFVAVLLVLLQYWVS